MSHPNFVIAPASLLVPPRSDAPLSEGNARMRFHIKRQEWRDTRRQQIAREAELHAHISEMRKSGQHALAEQCAAELESDLRDENL